MNCSLSLSGSIDPLPPPLHMYAVVLHSDVRLAVVAEPLALVLPPPPSSNTTKTPIHRCAVQDLDASLDLTASDPAAATNRIRHLERQNKRLKDELRELVRCCRAGGKKRGGEAHKDGRCTGALWPHVLSD